MPEPLRWDMILPNGEPLRFDMGPAFVWDGNVPENLNQTNHPMTEDNRISATLSAANLTAVLAAIDTIKTLMPFLVALTDEQRRELVRIGDKGQGFNEKVAGYMASHPQFTPNYVEAAEVTKDRTLDGQVLQVLTRLRPLCVNVEDTHLVINSDIQMANLGYYNNVAQAAKRGQPGADTIYDELSSRFPGRPKKITPAPTP